MLAIAKCANHGLTSHNKHVQGVKSMPKPTRIGILVHFSSSGHRAELRNQSVFTMSASFTFSTNSCSATVVQPCGSQSRFLDVFCRDIFHIAKRGPDESMAFI